MPEEIQQLSQRCCTHVQNRLDFKLDYTIETLSVLDHHLEQVVKEECRGILPPGGDKRRVPLIHLLSPTFGAYFGAVMAREFDARWSYTNLPPVQWRLDFNNFFLRFNPAGIAAEVIMQDKVETWGGNFVTAPPLQQHLLERFKAAPPVLEDQFFTFTSCHEVIQIAEEYLRERAQKDGPVGCTAKDYDNILGK